MKKQVLVVVLINIYIYIIFNIYNLIYIILNSKGAFEQTPSLRIKKMQLYIKSFHSASKLLRMEKCSYFNASSLDVSLKIGLMRV